MLCVHFDSLHKHVSINGLTVIVLTYISLDIAFSLK